jgi:hypothetical protein
VSSRHRSFAACLLTLTPVLAAAGQSTVAVSPFVSYVPSAATNPSAGFALTFGGTTGLALRAGGEMSLTNPARDTLATAGTYRPWGADADAMLFLGGLGGGATVFNRSLSPYAFAGIGLTGSDSAGKNVVGHGWSYGAGATIPLGADASIFGEARWRLSEYVLPTSKNAPDGKSSWRFGLSFHVGGGSSQPSGGYGRGGRRMAAAPQNDVEYVVTPAPAQPNVVVVQPAAPAASEVVVVEQEAAAAPETVYVASERSRSAEPTVVYRGASPAMRRPPARVTPRRTAVVVESSARTRGSTRVTAGSSSRASTTRTVVRNRTSTRATTSTTVRSTRPPQQQQRVVEKTRTKTSTAERPKATASRRRD